MPAPDPEDVAALVAEAREAGRADAAARLRELWRDAYLEAATIEPGPLPPPVDGSAWWVYCVVAATDATGVPIDVSGVARSPLEVIVNDRLAAVVSMVPLAEFNDERLREHLEDLAWVEQVARAHQAALEAAMGAATIVPLRLCTICLTRERVAELLAEQASEFQSTLDALRGRTEWGLKLFGPRAGSAETAPDAETDGSAYLESKRRARADREQVQQEALECARRVHEVLEAESVAVAVNPPQRPEAHGRDADMMLNSAYLVDDDRRDRLQVVVADLTAEYESLGFSIELTGPWPPYNFVSPVAPALQ